MMRPYINSKSPSARRAECRIDFADGTSMISVHALSTTKPRRALWRMNAHYIREAERAGLLWDRVESTFPHLDIYCGDNA